MFVVESFSTVTTIIQRKSAVFSRLKCNENRSSFISVLWRTWCTVSELVDILLFTSDGSRRTSVLMLYLHHFDICQTFESSTVCTRCVWHRSHCCWSVFTMFFEQRDSRCCYSCIKGFVSLFNDLLFAIKINSTTKPFLKRSLVWRYFRNEKRNGQILHPVLWTERVEPLVYWNGMIVDRGDRLDCRRWILIDLLFF